MEFLVAPGVDSHPSTHPIIFRHMSEMLKKVYYLHMDYKLSCSVMQTDTSPLVH